MVRAGTAAVVVAVLLLVAMPAPGSSNAAAAVGGQRSNGGLGWPIPFPIWNVSASPDEDQFPYLYGGDTALRLVWNKGFANLFEDQVVQREFDGVRWRLGEDWVSVPDPMDHNASVHEHYNHDGVAIDFQGLTYFVFASDDPAYTSGSDHDIVLRTLDPATRHWGPIVLVTPNHKGQDRQPSVAVFGDRLVIAWSTNDPAEGAGDTDIVMRTYDGAAFSDIVEVSQAGNGARDWAVDSVVVGDRLVLVWEWNNRTVRPDDYDVLYREWDGAKFLAPPLDVSVDPASSDTGPRVADAGGRPFIVWESTPPQGSLNGTAIQGRVMTDGGLGPLVAVTRPGSGADNLQPDAVSANGTAYVFWSTFDDALKHGSDSDIVVRPYDGSRLGDVVEVSDPNDDGVNESYVTAAVFRGNLYAAWMMAVPTPGVEGGVDLEVACRRVTDLTAEVLASPKGPRPVVGDAIPIEVRVRDFEGELASPEVPYCLTVTRDGRQVLPDLVLSRSADGTLHTTLEPSAPGIYGLALVYGGHAIGTTSVTVHAAPEGGGRSVDVGYALVAAVAIVAGLVAIYLGARRR